VRPGTRPALIGAALNLAIAVGIGVLRATNGSTGENHAEGWLPTIAIAATLAAPGVLALIGVATQRPVLYGAAGVACMPLVIVSVAAFPIVVPGVLLIVAFARAQTLQPAPAWLTGVLLTGFPVPLLVGLWILVTQTAEFTYTFPGGSEGGEYFTPGHAVLCIALVVADVVVAAALAGLRPATSAPTSQSAYGS
jgi:hypothetical protein